MRADYLLLPEALVLGQGNVGRRPAVGRAPARVEGIQAVTTIRFADATAYPSSRHRHGSADRGEDGQHLASQGTAVNVLGIDPATYPQLSGLTFRRARPKAHTPNWPRAVTCWPTASMPRRPG
jgi:hypothetical protein